MMNHHDSTRNAFRFPSGAALCKLFWVPRISAGACLLIVIRTHLSTAAERRLDACHAVLRRPTPRG